MLRVAIVHSGGHYVERVREHLEARSGADVRAYQVTPNLPLMLDEEEAAALIPAAVAEAEVVIAVHLHHALLLELPYVMNKGHGQALLAPREDPDWVRPGQMREVTKACGRFGIESAFPKPFCILEPKTPVIAQFAADYGVGRHRFAIECADGHIAAVLCPTGSACGLTQWVAEELIGQPCDAALPRVVVELLHLRPCLASMALDDETGDTIMHEAMHIMEQAGHEALAGVEDQTDD
jgi:hypothetical protein